MLQLQRKKTFVVTIIHICILYIYIWKIRRQRWNVKSEIWSGIEENFILAKVQYFYKKCAYYERIFPFTKNEDSNVRKCTKMSKEKYIHIWYALKNLGASEDLYTRVRMWFNRYVFDKYSWNIYSRHKRRNQIYLEHADHILESFIVFFNF